MTNYTEKSLAVKTLEEKLAQLGDKLDLINANQNSTEEERNAIFYKRGELLYAVDILEATEKIAIASQHMLWANMQKADN